MSDTKRCPSCGAQNAASAEWCTLCLTRFDNATLVAPRPSDETQPAPAAESEDEAARELATLAAEPPIVEEAPATEQPAPPAPVARAPVTFVREGEKVRWVCPSCDTVNDIESGACRICGTVMAQLFAPDKKEQKTSRSAASTMALSALLPGLGHLVQGETAMAVGRGILYLWTTGISILLIARAPVKGRAVVQAVGFAFAAAALGVWLVSLMESQRLAAGDRRPVVQPRMMTWIFTGLTLLLFLGVLVAATAGRAG